MAEDFGVAEAVLVAEDDDGFVPGSVDHAVLGVTGGGAAAGDGDGVAGLGEGGEEMVGGGAAAVFADVDDEAVFAGTGGIEFFFEAKEAGFIHGADVKVAELAVRGFFNALAIVFDPLVVEEGAGGGIGDGAECDRALFGIDAANEEGDVAFDGAVQDAAEFGGGLDRVVVDFEDDFAGGDAAEFEAGGAFGDDVADFPAGAGVGGIEAEAEVGGFFFPGAGCGCSGWVGQGEAEVGAVEFSEHEMDDVLDGAHVGCGGGHGGVFLTDGIPVAIAEAFVIVVVTHDLPALVEDGALFGGAVDSVLSAEGVGVGAAFGGE